jgi:hypothetical protein
LRRSRTTIRRPSGQIWSRVATPWLAVDCGVGRCTPRSQPRVDTAWASKRRFDGHWLRLPWIGKRTRSLARSRNSGAPRCSRALGARPRQARSDRRRAGRRLRPLHRRSASRRPGLARGRDPATRSEPALGARDQGRSRSLAWRPCWRPPCSSPADGSLETLPSLTKVTGVCPTVAPRGYRRLQSGPLPWQMQGVRPRAASRAAPSSTAWPLG